MEAEIIIHGTVYETVRQPSRTNSNTAKPLLLNSLLGYDPSLSLSLFSSLSLSISLSLSLPLRHTHMPSEIHTQTGLACTIVGVTQASWPQCCSSCCWSRSPICISKHDLDTPWNKLISLQPIISSLLDLLSELLIVKL